MPIFIGGGARAGKGVLARRILTMLNTIRQAYPTQVRACFLGYSIPTPTQKLNKFRTFSRHPNDWAREFRHANLLDAIIHEIAFIRYLQAECVRFTIGISIHRTISCE